MQDMLADGQQGTLTSAATVVRAADETLPCALVNNLAANTEEQCKFILDNECLEDEATIDYVYLVFCRIDHDMRLLAITLVVFLVIVLFLNLGAVADEFLCPSLLTVARNLRMSDSLAGVTLLAFGNGCPDIFSSLAAVSSGRPELIVGELLGAGIFCTSIVAGLIFISADFKIARRPILRDTSFYLLAVYLIWLYCSQSKVTFYGALAFIIIYVIYLLTALIGQAVHSRLRGEYPMAEMDQANEKAPSSARRPSHEDESDNDKKVIYRQLEELMRRRSSSLVDVKALAESARDAPKQSRKLQVSTIQISNTVKDISASDGPQAAAKTQVFDAKTEVPKLLDCELAQKSPRTKRAASKLSLDEFDQFLDQINPIGGVEWSQAGLFARMAALLRSPLLLATTLTVPVVDCEKPNNNWCRLLNSIHCFAIPAALVSLARVDGLSSWWQSGRPDDDTLHQATLGNVTARTALSEQDLALVGEGLISYSKYLVLAAGLALALYIFNTTSPGRPPKYHSVFAYFGFLMSVVWIYKLANEIISLLKTIGIIFSMSDTAIGLGFLAWGNSLGDIVANLTLAQAGYARMALGASIGAPLLNLLLGFGLSFSVSLKPGESADIDYNDTMVLLAGTLALILALLMSSTLLPQNKSKKPFGYLLIACYALYFLLAVCIECDLI